jgi:hypothetical protein
MEKMNYDRLIKKVTANLATGVRGDLSIADFQKLDSVSAHVLLEYEPKHGKPTGNEIEHYFRKTFEGKILPVMASCAIKGRAISIVAKQDIPTRDFEDTKDKAKMTPVIVGNLYLDNELRDHWEVKDQDGKKILAKNSEDNIEQIIAMRRNRMFVTETPSVSLASVAAAKELLVPGDIVKSFYRGEIQALEITAAIKGGYKAKTLAGKEAVIAKEGVLDLQAQNAEKTPNESAKLAKYFEEAYGDKKYAQQLVKK